MPHTDAESVGGELEKNINNGNILGIIDAYLHTLW